MTRRIYFDPTSVESIVEAILSADRQPDLLEQHLKAAPGVLARFDWPKAARDLRRLLPGSGRRRPDRRAADALRGGRRLVKLDVVPDAPAADVDRPLTVAINAQIDPERAGGVETAVQGLVGPPGGPGDRRALPAALDRALRVGAAAAGRRRIRGRPVAVPA